MAGPLCRKEKGNKLNRKGLFIYTDGACRGNPGQGGIGAVIKDEEENTIKRISRYIGKTTNNVAEYTALLSALKAIKDYNTDYIKIHSDSELLINQLSGRYGVKNLALYKLYSKAVDLINKYSRVELQHIPREENREADSLANNAIDRRLKAALK